MGTKSVTPPQPLSTGASMTLIKMATGEFVLQGNDAQRLLMEYFEQSPELWLRLMALKGEDNDEKGTE